MTHRLCSIVALAALSTASHGSWTATILHPTGQSSSEAMAVSGVSQVGLAGGKASLWSGTAASWVDLTPSGAVASLAYGCTASKQVGYAMFGSSRNAGLWSGTAASWVNLHPATATDSDAYDVFGSTQVGSAVISSVKRAAKWTGTAASWVDLHPSGATSSSANGVSATNQVGEARISGKFHACLWTGTAASFVDLLPVAATESFCSATSGPKQVGTANIGGSFHAALWSGTAASFVDLHPAGATSSEARGISGNYQAGTMLVTGGTRAVIWSGTAASAVNLHDFLPSNYSSSYANAVYTDGANIYVVGNALNSSLFGRSEAILWKSTLGESFEFILNKTQVAGQNSVQGTITASGPDPAARVYTTYDNSSLVNTPPSVTLAANATVKNFQITTTAVNSTINTTVYAKREAITRSRPLALIPLIPTALAFTPAQVTGGQPTSCRVVINGVAGPGGRTIAILDNSPYSTVPSTVTVPAGATQVIFNITTTAVTSQKTVTVTARVSAGEKTGTFKINP